jgi:hypothetical protein
MISDDECIYLFVCYYSADYSEHHFVSLASLPRSSRAIVMPTANYDLPRSTEYHNKNKGSESSFVFLQQNSNASSKIVTCIKNVFQASGDRGAWTWAHSTYYCS